MEQKLKKALLLSSQLKGIRNEVDKIDPESKPGSGITAFIKDYNQLLENVRLLVAESTEVSESITHLEPARKIEEKLQPTYHKVAKAEILGGIALLLSALEAYLGPTESDLAHRMIEVQFVERREQLDREVQQVAEEMNLHGTLRSGGHIKLVRDLCSRELAIRASIVWQVLVRVLSSEGFLPSETPAAGLKAELQKYLSQERTDLEGILEERVARFGMPQTDISLLEAYERALNKTDAEIDLWMLNQQRITEAASPPGTAVQPIITVHGQVGAIQTGAGATASVTFISSEDRKAIQEAVERALEAVSAADLPNKGEVLELLEEVRSEAKKDKPNSMRLRSLLGTAASAVSTVASLGAAYQTLKGVCTLVGITLP